MRGLGHHFAAWAALLSLAWLAALAVHAQPTAGAAVAAPAPLVLESTRQTLTLNRRARVLIDAARHTTPDALESATDSLPWRMRDLGDSYNIDGKVLWFQFDAWNRGSQRWFLELGAAGIDRVQLFYRSPDGKWVMQEAGDTRAVSDWPLPGRVPTFELVGPTDKPVRYWIRIEHERVDFAAPIWIKDEASLFGAREAEQFFLGGCFSLAALIALLSVANAIAYRDRNFAVYACYVMLLAAGQLAYLGVGAQHLWEHWLRWNEMASFVLPGMSAAAGLWFTRTITEPQRFSRSLDLAVWAVIAALVSAVAVDVILGSRQSFMLVVALAGVSLLFLAILVGAAWLQDNEPYVKFVALGLLPVVITAVFPILRGFGLVPVTPLTRYGVSIGAALQMPILYYAITLRGSRRREAAVRAASLSRSDTLTGLAHTRSFLQRLDGALQRCRTLRHACGLLAVKIGNYDSIIAEFGRDAAERSLVLAASLLRNVASNADMAARVGDHHFALLIEGPATAQDASTRAQQLVASGLRPSDALPAGLVLKFHVASALLPDRQLDADGALKWLLDSVNAIRHDARKLIWPLNF